MASVRDSFLDLERHRRQLEENVTKLSAALATWRKWDADYECLREEVEDLSASPAAHQRKELARIRRDFEGQVIEKKEIHEIFGRGDLKPPPQIIGLLARRIDYVTQNIETLQKQLEAAENKFAAATIVSQPDALNEEGEPITEIIEELDEDGNVLSYRLQRPGDSEPQMREILEKAGVKREDLPAVERQSEPPDEPLKDVKRNTKAVVGPATQRVTEPSFDEQSRPVTARPKKVAFAEDTKSVDKAEGSAPAAQGSADDDPANLARRTQRISRIMQDAKEQEEKLRQSRPVIPDNESEEDAAMRREMLKYSLGEVGEVVAELTLEEGETDDDADDDYDIDDYDDYDDYDDDEDDEDEDEHGKSTKTAITAAYRRRMMDLERRLGLQSRLPQDVTEAPEDPEEISSDDDDEVQDGVGRIVVNSRQGTAAPATTLPNEPPPTAISSAVANSKSNGKKAVRFATTLDVAPDQTTTPPESQRRAAEKTKVDPLSETVVENTGSFKPEQTKASPGPRRASRFRKQRDNVDQDVSTDDFVSTVATGPPGNLPKGPMDVPATLLNYDHPVTPTGPKDVVISDVLVERDPSSTKTVDMEDEVVNDVMLRQEVAEEFHRQRRKFIQRNGGGFLKEDENPIQPLDEESGDVPRVSRFKAARLSKR